MPTSIRWFVYGIWPIIGLTLGVGGGCTSGTVEPCRIGLERNAAGACVNTNECDPTKPNPCSGMVNRMCQDVDAAPNGVPTPQDGYRCVCATGYGEVAGQCVSTRCQDTTTCGAASGRGTCMTTSQAATYLCSCNAGYEDNGNTAAPDCVDTNECMDTPTICGQGTCSNSPGSYDCSCSVGFQKDPNGGRPYCTDVDECARALDNCDVNATCQNTPGAFQCTCLAGYDGNGVTCTERNECAFGNPCGEDTVGSGNSCTNTTLGYTCTCGAGYTPSGTASQPGCDDRDECVLNSDDCAPNATCANTTGSFTCTCPTGFAGTGHGTGGCADVDECAIGADNCHVDAVCTNTVGSFTCACANGYSGNGFSCTEIDECATNTDNCSTFATCTNTPGSFLCACASGYAGNGVVCSDIDECAANTDNCSPYATCTNSAGSFSCACISGYTGNGINCAEVDECLQGTDNCSANAICTNTAGSFACSCASGFTGNGVNCSDVNECMAGTHDCDARATCTNSVGSFTCACNPGFAGDGRTCSDINECAIGTATCDPNASCANTSGSYSCTCVTGYVGTGAQCTIVDCGSAPSVPNGTVSTLGGTTYNQVATYTCNAGFQVGGAATRTCQADGTWSAPAVACVDIDECALGTDSCDVHAACSNTTGSFTCACVSPYTGDGTTCTCPAPYTQCGNTCADLSSDEANCGACGYDVRGSRQCVGGAPSPGWEAVATANYPLSAPAAMPVWTGKRILFIGAAGSSEVKGYDPSTDTWAALPLPPTGINASATHRWLIGMPELFQALLVQSDGTYLFDDSGSSPQWTAIGGPAASVFSSFAATDPSIPQPVAYTGPYVFIFDHRGLGRGIRFNTATRLWSNTTDAPSFCSKMSGVSGFFGVGFAAGNVVLIGSGDARSGSQDYCGPTQQVAYLDPASATWLPTSTWGDDGFFTLAYRSEGSFIGSGNFLYATGGYDASYCGNQSITVWSRALDVSQNNVEIPGITTPGTKVGRTFLANTGRTIFQWGGAYHTSNCGSYDVYNVAEGFMGELSASGIIWHTLPTSPLSARALGAGANNTQSLWTGREMILVGAATAAGGSYANVRSGARYQPEVGCVCPALSGTQDDVLDACAGVSSIGAAYQACTPN